MTNQPPRTQRPRRLRAAAGNYPKRRAAQVILGVVITILCVLNPAYSETPNLWTAQWITAADVPQRDQVVLHFRKTLNLASVPEHFVVQVSADNQFILYVNRQRVGNGPARSDLAHWRCETYDIAPMLHQGSNLLSATVWNFGIYAAIAQMSDRTAFLLHGATEEERAADTNDTWEVEVEKGIRATHLKAGGYYAAEPGERLDGAAFDWSWDAAAEANSSWTKPVALGRGALRGETDAPNNWQLVADPLPPMEMKLVPAGKIVRFSGVNLPGNSAAQDFVVPPHTQASVLIDNSTLITGYPELTVSGGSGSSVRLTYAEALVDAKGEKGNRNEIEGKHITGLEDEFLPDGSDARVFVPLAWRTWRYLQLDFTTGDSPLHAQGLRTWFSAFPFEERAHFDSDDASLKPIWDISWRTARLDAHDTYMDTPYWERLQYGGDTRIQILLSYTVAGDDRLARQAINAFNYSRIADGITQSRYPSSLVQIIPTFSLLWVGMVHDFWMYRDDPEFVRSQLLGVRTTLDWFLHKQRANGLMGKIPWWPFVDWGKDFEFGMPPQEEDGDSAVITLQFIEALRYAAEMEAALGDAHQAEIYREAATRASQAVLKLCWSQKYGLLADTPAQTHFSQHANILGVWLDVIPREGQRDVMQKILSASDPGFSAAGPVPSMTEATYYFRFYLARALEHAGMGDRYLDLLGPWHQMVSLGLTTWAENPEPTRSDSHAWSAHPDYDLLTIVAGLRPRVPGFSSVVIEPHLGKLRHVSAALPHPKGMIETEYTLQAGGVDAQISLPAGVSGELVWKGKTLKLHEGNQKLTLPGVNSQ
ncbi:MAG TPA: alpha-L-rhamnosidase C-terminal domain-containing protein [Terriglobales bacterium]|nr:alpha-L-rhamnosidase C-terminal domain-containing protein [Terriglobales bacterium]